MLDDDVNTSLIEPAAEQQHLGERVVGQDILQRGAHGTQAERVASESAADAAAVDEVDIGGGGEAGADVAAQAVRSSSNAAADALADDNNVRVEFPRLDAAAGARADGVCLVPQHKRPVPGK